MDQGRLRLPDWAGAQVSKASKILALGTVPYALSERITINEADV